MPHSLSALDAPGVTALYQSGLSMKETARRLSVDAKTLRVFFLSHGIQKRKAAHRILEKTCLYCGASFSVWQTSRFGAKYCSQACSFASPEWRRHQREANWRRSSFDDRWIPEPMSGCHLWTASITRRGYGRYWWQGSTRFAHRVAWLLAGRELEPGFDLHHTCRTPSCVNIHHLRPIPHVEHTRKFHPALVSRATVTA